MARKNVLKQSQGKNACLLVKQYLVDWLWWLETDSLRVKLPFTLSICSSYRNDFAFIGLSHHSCRLPHLQAKYKVERKVK